MAKKKPSKNKIQPPVYEDDFDREEARLKREKKQEQRQKRLSRLPAPLRRLFKVEKTTENGVDTFSAAANKTTLKSSAANARGFRAFFRKKFSGYFRRLKEDLVIAVNTPEERLMIWRAPHHGTKNTFFKEYECPFTSLEDPVFRERFDHVLANYLSGNPAGKRTGVYILLPDSALAMDIISLPRMKRALMADAIKTEAKLLYLNHKDLMIRYSPLSADKQASAFNVTLLRLGVQTVFYDALNERKLYPQALLGTSTAILNGALALRSKLHNKNFVFLDMKENTSYLVFCSKNTVCGYKRLDLGYSILRDDRVLFEPELYDHSVAELAVLNAEEAARAKMLTVAGDDAGPDAGGEAVPESFLDKVNSAASGDSAGTTGTGAVPSGKTPKVFAKAAPKKHPKFMQREVPDTPEGIRYENFRIFEKWTLLFIRSCEQMTPTVKPDFVMLNIPSAYAGVLEAVNANGAENRIRFRYFNPDQDQNPVLTEHLELYGITVSDKYNKSLIF